MKPYILISAIVAMVVLIGAGCFGPQITYTNNAEDYVRNVNIKPGQKVTSPLTVSGEAKGPWYFEANFLVKLIDANGKVLGQRGAQAQGEWMTENYVPFKVEFSFSPATTTSGTLILERDNASGLPQYDASYNIPITF